MTTFAERATNDTAPTTPTDSAPRILTPAETYTRNSATRRAMVPFIELTRQYWWLLTDAGTMDEHLKSILSDKLFILPNHRGRKATVEQLATQMNNLRWLIELCEQANATEQAKAKHDQNYRPRIIPIPSADALQWLANMA